VKTFTTALTADEIRAYYKSEGPQDFFTVGAEEEGGAPPGPGVGIDININDTLQGTTVSGTETIDFNISSTESEVHAKFYISTAAQNFDCDIETDLNLNDYAAVAGLNCSDANFEDSTNCTYSWDSWEALKCISDGARFVDLNAWNYSGAYSEDLNSSGSFTFDNEPVHDGNWSYSIGGILDVENGTTTVSITLTDISTRHLVTNDSFEWDRNGSIISTDQNFVHSDGNIGDLNICFFATQSYDYNADSWVDGNCMVVHVQSYPQDVNFVWFPTVLALEIPADFNGTASGPAISIWNFGFTAPDENKSDQNTTHTFNSSGQKTVCLTVQNFDDLNRTTCHDLNIFGRLVIRFQDEKSFSPITASVAFNDQNYSTSELSVDLNGFPGTSQNYALRAWDGTRHYRTLELDLNKFSDYNITMLLLETNFGREVEFKFYEPDGTTLLADARVAVLIDANYLEWKYLDSAAETVFFLDTNFSGYTFHIVASDGNVYDYSAIVVTVKIPLREDLLSTSISPFEIDVRGLVRFTDVNLVADTNVLILGNTAEYYELVIGDWNKSDYYSRGYFVRVLGNADYILQPYLVSVSNGMLSALIGVDQVVTPLKQVLFVIQKQLTGIEVETVVTAASDDTGIAVVNWVAGDTYYVLIYYQDAYYGQVLIRPSSDTYYISVIQELIGMSQASAKAVYFDFSPSVQRIGMNDFNQYHFDVNVFALASNMERVELVAVCDGAVKYSEIKTVNIATNALFSVDVNDNNVANCRALIVTVTATTSAGTVSSVQTYGLSKASFYFLGSGAFGTTLLAVFGVQGALFISFFITILVVGACKMSFDASPMALGIIGGAMIGLFTYLTWIPVPVAVFAFFLGGALMVLGLRLEE